jgi:hypothetical protein
MQDETRQVQVEGTSSVERMNESQRDIVDDALEIVDDVDDSLKDQIEEDLEIVDEMSENDTEPQLDRQIKEDSDACQISTENR